MKDITNPADLLHHLEHAKIHAEAIAQANPEVKYRKMADAVSGALNLACYCVERESVENGATDEQPIPAEQDLESSGTASPSVVPPATP